MIIDFQHHYTPPHLLDHPLVQGMAINKAGKVPKYYMPPALTDLDQQLRDMDEGGIDMAVLTSGLGMDGATVEICRMVNDALAAVVARRPDRFRMLAHVPALGGEAALAELDRCIAAYGVPGVVTISEVEGRTLDDPALDHFWAACEARGLYVFVHPALRPNVGPQLDAYDLVRSIGREFSLATALLRLVLGGAFDRFPRLKVQFGHLAGNVAVQLERVRGFLKREDWGTVDDPVHGRLPARPLDHYLAHNLWVDTAGIFGSLNAVRATLGEVPAARVVFGTDYPLEIRTGAGLRGFVEGLTAMGADGAAVLRGSAPALLPLGAQARAA